MGVNFMLWSRVGLSSLAIAGLLTFSGMASAMWGGDDNTSYDGYSYSNGVYIPPVPAAPMVRMGYGYHHSCHGGYHHHYKHHAYNGHHSCHMPMYRGFYVCKMYTYEITPMHRDVACSKWQFEWKHVSAAQWHRYHHHHVS
jgi:hypothetical protein